MADRDVAAAKSDLIKRLRQQCGSHGPYIAAAIEALIDAKLDELEKRRSEERALAIGG